MKRTLDFIKFCFQKPSLLKRRWPEELTVSVLWITYQIQSSPSCDRRPPSHLPVCNRKIRSRWKGLASLLYAKDKGIFTGLGAFLRTNLKYIIAVPADTLRTVLSSHTSIEKKYSENCFKDLLFKICSKSSPCENFLKYSNSMKLQISPISWRPPKCSGSWRSRRSWLRQSYAAHTLQPVVVYVLLKYGELGLVQQGVNLERQENTFQEVSYTHIAAGATKNGTDQSQGRQYSGQQSSGQEKNILTT